MMTKHETPDQMPATRKRNDGAVAYFSGCAAETSVARAYVERGCELLESRWRGPSGEIDLIFSDAGELVFVEVKKARSFDAAVERLRPAQARRIHMAACEYLDHTPCGPLTPMRFDLALVNATGETDIREAAFSHL